MDEWEKFNKTSLPEKEDFYSHLNIEDITDADYKHAKRVCKDFKLKNLGEYHDLYVQCHTLLIAAVFSNFLIMYLEIYELEPARIFSAPALAWVTVKLDLLTEYVMNMSWNMSCYSSICKS